MINPTTINIDINILSPNDSSSKTKAISIIVDERYDQRNNNSVNRILLAFLYNL